MHSFDSRLELARRYALVHFHSFHLLLAPVLCRAVLDRKIVAGLIGAMDVMDWYRTDPRPQEGDGGQVPHRRRGARR